MIPQTPQKTVHYRGNKIILMEKVPQVYGPGAIVHIDANSDGVFEHQVTTDANGLYTISIDAPVNSITDKPVYSKSEPYYFEIIILHQHCN